MAIFLDENTKVVYQGLTGSTGRYYGNLNREYGTQVVGGTHPKKAGTDVDGMPIFATVADAKEATGCTASCVFVPPVAVKGAVMEAAEAGMELVVVITQRAKPGHFNVVGGHAAFLSEGAMFRAPRRETRLVSGNPQGC